MTYLNEIKIVLVDDHKLLRDGLRNIIEQKSNMCIIGEASDGREAIKIVSKLLPDVVVMDVAMPGLNGIEAATQIYKIHSDIKIIGLFCRDRETNNGNIFENFMFFHLQYIRVKSFLIFIYIC